eukprot:comp20538_c0_seq1/m.26338 comp20538_c0_seq1/g.26338  ORF comp20538_c0_seq1/g.26338 comp20538_c0_seq1/m.26338 type:complete len:636 (-) comp20538_c0_seq1:708-2615(-)
MRRFQTAVDRVIQARSCRPFTALGCVPPVFQKYHTSSRIPETKGNVSFTATPQHHIRGYSTAAVPASSVPVPPAGPMYEYCHLLGLQKVTPDPNQRRAVEELQRVYDDLVHYLPPTTESLADAAARARKERKEKMEHKKAARVANKNEESMIDPEEEEYEQPLIISNVKMPDPNFKPPLGLYLHGNVGTGKTMLMDIFYQSVNTPLKKRLHFHTLLNMLYGAMHQWRKQGHPDSDIEMLPQIAEWLLQDAWLVCFDEVQSTDVATAAILYSLFRALINRGAVVVCTSNRPPDELSAGGYREELFTPFIKLLKEHCLVVNMDSEMDYRSEQLQAGLDGHFPSYFSPLNATSKSLFEQRYCQLIGGASPRPAVLRVMGRDVVVPQQANGVARFPFDELCNKPLGAADYMAICKQYHTLAIEGVPRLNVQRKNEARRMITLLDAVYEYKVKLILSADSEPSDLFHTMADKNIVPGTADDVMHREMLGEMAYEKDIVADYSNMAILTGKDEQFAFSRAVSRLNEMQTPKYWSLSHQPEDVHLRVPHYKPTGEEHDGHRRAFWDVGRWEGRGMHTVTDDFAEEASYTAYTMSMIKRRQANAPKLKEAHFWGMGQWGVKAGEWGAGIARMLRGGGAERASQ